MKPELLKLFQLPQRLYAGQNVKIRGHGDNKQIEGFRLSSNKKSPVLASQPGSSLPTKPLSAVLRPLPGKDAQLHGYGGVYSISKTVESSALSLLRQGLAIARLTIERQVKAINGSICANGASTESPGNYRISETTVDVYENGTVTSSVTASGVIQTWEEGDTPDACADLVYDSDFDPGFDYGALESSSFTETLVSYADFYSEVITAMLALPETLESSTTTWTLDEWAAASDATTGWKAVLAPYIGVTGSEGADNCVAGSMRWRAVNDGTRDIRVYWSLVKAVDDSVVTSGDFTLAPNEVSDWFGPPTALPYLEEAVKYKITRVRINGL